MEFIQDEKVAVESINNNSLALIFFSGSSCTACQVIAKKLEAMLTQYPQVYTAEINIVLHHDLAASYGVYSSPIYMLFVEGKESIRLSANLDLLDLEKRIARYVEMLG